MSQNDVTEKLGHHEVSERSIEHLFKLVSLARQAYDQKRTKDCLDLTRSILLIDPDNGEALSLRSSVQSQMQRDLENARAMFQNSPSGEAAEVPRQEESQPQGSARVQPLSMETLRLAAAYAGALPRPRRRWVKHATVGIVLGVTVLAVASFRPASVQQHAVTPIPVDNPKAIANESLVSPDVSLRVVAEKVLPPAATQSVAAPIAVSKEQTMRGDQSGVVEPPVSRPVTTAADAGPIATTSGTLAVSSPTSVDIYQGDTFLGSAPVSLELSAGPQTLEYRHGNLRRTLTHMISSNETTRAMVTFDVTVQINSKPWAEVFQDGVERKGLGQTPLSGVRVPIGAVLVFQNPKFQPKKYRVTGNETGIQIVFP